MVATSQRHHPPPPRIQVNERTPPTQEELRHPQSHIPGTKVQGNVQNREQSRRSKDQLSPIDRNI